MATEPLALGVARWLLDGAGALAPSTSLDDAAGAEVLSVLRRHRIAGECAASARLATTALPAVLRRGLAVERERVRHAAALREPFVVLAGEILAKAAIPAMLLKGLAVIELTHRDPSRRPMADADILVAPHARRPAREALILAGFEATAFDSPLHDVLVHRGHRGASAAHVLALEVHSDVVAPPHPLALDLGGVLERARPSSRRGLLLPEHADAMVLGAVQLAVHETDAAKTLAALRDLALLGTHAATAENGGVPPWAVSRAVAVRAASAGLHGLLAGVGRLAETWAGGPAWLAAAPSGDLPRVGRRRRLATWLALREMEGLLAAGSVEPRALSRRLTSALWQERPADTWRSLAQGLGGGGAVRALAVLLRHVQALARRPGPDAAP